jgi:uncharacterized lipoprotein YmbA
MLAVAGCASSPPSTFFSLSPLPAAAGQGAMTGGALGIGLGPVTFPAFLDRPQIVSRDAGNRLAVDEYNRWGGTIQDDFLRVWSENLSYLVGTSRMVLFPSEVRYPLDFRVTADILTFEGTPGGEAVLKVRWAVLDPLLERALAVHENTYRQPLRPPADHAALIAAMSAALGAFSADVAAVLRTLPKPLSTGEQPVAWGEERTPTFQRFTFGCSLGFVPQPNLQGILAETRERCPSSSVAVAGWASLSLCPSYAPLRPHHFGPHLHGGVQQRRSLVNCTTGHHVLQTPA